MYDYILAAVPTHSITQITEDYQDLNGEIVEIDRWDLGFEPYSHNAHEILKWKSDLEEQIQKDNLNEEDIVYYIFWFDGHAKLTCSSGPIDNKNEAILQIVDRKATSLAHKLIAHIRGQAKELQSQQRRQTTAEAAKEFIRQWHNQEFIATAYYRDTQSKNPKYYVLSPDGLENPAVTPIIVWELPKNKNIRPLIIYNGTNYYLLGYKGNQKIGENKLKITKDHMTKSK